MFQMRSPTSARRSSVHSPSQAASICGAKSPSVQAKVVKRQRPEESTAAVASWKAMTSPALPSVDRGSVFSGMPRISEATV